jgi:RNA polymerase sigma factor (sigma-70 family)
MDLLDGPYDSQSSGFDEPLSRVTPDGLRRYRAERLLRKDFARLRSKVLAIVRSQLRRRGITLDASDLEACYAQAWNGLYAAVLDGEAVENPSAWLVLVTFRRAIDESRAARRVEVGAEADGAGAFETRAGAANPDFAAELDDRDRLRQVFEGLRANLSKRECEAASLCYLQGLSRTEAAERMGISEARMRKLMEGAGRSRPGVAGKMGELLDAISAGSWCEQQSSLMRAFAFGILDPEGERHALAAAHCRACPACRAHVASLRGLASVLPAPLLSPLALAGGSAATGGQGAAGVGAPAPTRLAATGLRVGGRFNGGWSGLAGSLTAKLAVTALVVLGAGYALLGSRAHGNLPAARAAGSPALIDGEALSRLPFPGLRASARRNRSVRRPLDAGPRSAHGRRPGREAGSREFGPERVLREAATMPPAAAPAQPRNSSRPTREFGIE